MKKRHSSKTISSIYHSTAILSAAHERKNKRKKNVGKYNSGKYEPNEKKVRQAFEMRQNPTSLERALYASLDRVIGKRKISYEKQSIQRGYILDAYIPDLKLCLEADGPYHSYQSDQIRDARLSKAGIRTVRFNEAELRTSIDMVDEVIQYLLKDKTR